MKEAMEKVQSITHGYDCFEHSGQSTPTASTISRLLRFGAVVLIVGAVLMLCASMAALYLWKVNDKNVYNVRYSMNINGEVREGSVEIDSDNNLERFKTGSGAEEAVEIHDFQIGITGIRFFGGDKCYIKSQIKANLPHMGAHNKESLMFDLTDELTPVRFDEEVLIWVAGEQPLKDTSFLSDKILSLCGKLPIYWLQPSYTKGYFFSYEIIPSHRFKENYPVLPLNSLFRVPSQFGSAYNPENPYHVKEDAMTFDTMLDHQGICCSECQRSYTHCQRICEPLRGYWPWPYNYRGCQVACRVIMPCRWWVARILGVV
uniref:Leukocyte cell-derived chemotaxin 1 n=1 Tax=Echeneis naucrates TaxID=173247 RepID=A0A665TR87_ECHNA